MKEARLRGAYTDCIIPLTQSAGKYKLVCSPRALAGAGAGRSVAEGSQQASGIRAALRGDGSPLICLPTLSKTETYTCALYFL